MKVAITGGTAGIGQALADLYQQQGHEVLRLSRRNGHNIRSIPKIATVIEACDVFVNNAQAGFAQTELLFEMSRRWRGTGKHIVSIGTMMTLQPVCTLPGMSEYYIQKIALDAAHRELSLQQLGVRFTLIRPGNVATSADKTVPPARDVGEWSRHVFELLQSKFHQPEINVG